MSDQAKPQILFLDPDLDFLESMIAEGATREVNVVTKIFSARDHSSAEESVMASYPDIVVVNLDQDDELSFGNPVLDILRVPMPIPPIIMGTTNRDALALKQRAYQMGIDDYLIRPFASREVWLRLDVLLRTRRLQRQLDQATRKLSSVNAQLHSSNRHLEEMTLTDELTGLNNMRFMTQYLDKQFLLFSRHDRAFSIMMIDLDHFKEVNDQNDHLVGSATIKRVGAIIHEATRGSDIKARYGGDEYIVAMPETDRAAAIIVGERIRESVEKCLFGGNENSTFHVTSSIGVGVLDGRRHQSFKDVLKDADYALYLAKKQGRNQVVVYDHGLLLEQSGGKDADYDETQSAVLSEVNKHKT